MNPVGSGSSRWLTGLPKWGWSLVEVGRKGPEKAVEKEVEKAVGKDVEKEVPKEMQKEVE